MYSNWYVLYVSAGKESAIKDRLEKYLMNSIQMKIFQKEILHKRKGKTIKTIQPIFPGYIFIHKEINEALMVSKQHLRHEIIYPVTMNKKPSRVRQNEIDLLLHNSDNNGVFQLSEGFKVNEKIIIKSGPLKNIQGNILWIDEKKKKAKVEISLFDRKMKVNLGIQILL